MSQKYEYKKYKNTDNNENISPEVVNLSLWLHFHLH